MGTTTLYINGNIGYSNKGTGLVGVTAVVVYKLAITYTLKIVLSSVLCIL